ncbi:MAG: hypothetical protein HPY69_16200 [Armatimonadetes bacterium]|nr:hypothetical protein [Armatimonadota bacterium]
MPEVITQAEMDALLNVAGRITADGQGPSAGVTFYDFRNPLLLSARELQILRQRFRTLAGMLSRLLSAYLSQPMQLALQSLDVCTQAHYASTLASPTVLGVVTCEPGPTRVFWELSPDLADAALDCMLGGTGRGGREEDRGLGPVSQRVLACLFREVLSAWVELWPDLSESRPRLERVQDTPPDPGDSGFTERVVQALMVGTCGQREGSARLCLPVATVHRLLRQRPSSSQPPSPQPFHEGPVSALAKTRIALTASLDGPQISIQRLLQLKPGEVLNLHLPPDSPCLVKISGRPKFQAAIGTSRGRRAVELCEALAEESTS